MPAGMCPLHNLTKFRSRNMAENDITMSRLKNDLNLLNDIVLNLFFLFLFFFFKLWNYRRMIVGNYLLAFVTRL